jgi:transketolase
MNIHEKTVAALKGLVIDGVSRAGSGHPGGALSSMDLAYWLYTEFLRWDPMDPHWLGRDRFVLSAGHESMLLYSLLFGADWLSLEDLQGFRRLHSRTPGHPEQGLTPGVEVTTGPLGQGAGMSLGLALAARHLEARVDRKMFSAQRIWVLLGDGCMQEDITYSSASLAGHLGLGNLIWIYDRNGVQISGPIGKATSDREALIYEGLGWHVQEIDGHNPDQIRQSYQRAREETTKPSLIIARTVMAKGAATLEGSSKAHGSPFSKEEILGTKEKLGLPKDQDFYWPPEVKACFQRRFSELAKARLEWDRGFELLSKERLWYLTPGNPEILPSPVWPPKPISTRSAFGKLLGTWAPLLPGLMGGSADLSPSVMTEEFGALVGDLTKENPGGRHINFGVREFSMSALTNGLALYGVPGLYPFDATFLSFSDYSRPALRLGALQKARVIHEFTHDSFYLGEDGPTHQPVEHLMALRLIPDLYTVRPGDAQETEILLREALTSWDKPSAFCLSRQDLPLLPQVKPEDVKRGAWLVRDAAQGPDLVIYATGSEVALALKAAEELGEFRVSVVSVPCFEIFFEQPKDYQKAILMPTCSKRVSMEAGRTLGWERWVGPFGLSIGLDTFGLSGKASDLEVCFGFDPKTVVERIREYMNFPR